VTTQVKRRSGIHLAILDMLRTDGPMGVRDVAQKLGKDEIAVQSAFGGMVRHGDVVRLKCKPGQWARYRVRAVHE
jgi:predicted transcriptional regulator